MSAGLVALGLIATATRIGTAFYAFGLILLSTLSFIGFVTCDRVLQSGIEELHYAERIARLRAYYFDFAPELTHYLASVPPSRRLAILGLRSIPDVMRLSQCQQADRPSPVSFRSLWRSFLVRGHFPGGVWP